MNQEKFQPFIPADRILPEITFTSIVSGVMLAIIFGVVNTYLGLKIGMTISASIPAAVVSMSLTRIIMKRNSILENNIVQTIGSAGESLAAGVIFTVPAMFLWIHSAELTPPSIGFITLVSLLGGTLGVMFMIPLRKALIVKEHGRLLYPEGTACADVLLVGEEGGNKVKATFGGMGLGAVYKFFADGLRLFPANLEYKTKYFLIGGEALPALLGVGFIIGKRVAGFMLGGSLLAWIVIIPIISVFGSNSSHIIFPASVPVHQLTNWDLWNFYIRYIGAGAVAFGGMLSLLKSIPVIYETFIEIIKDYRELKGMQSTLRTEKDIPMYVVGLVIGFLVLTMVIHPSIKVGIAGAFIIVIFGFFFSTISSRIVGLVGSSSNPISGMTIATLIIASLIFKGLRGAGAEAIFSVLTVGSIICITIAVAGDTSQDLKTGFLIGATPYKQQIGEILGVITTALVLGGVLVLLNTAWGFGSSYLPAPQATLVKLVVEGVMQGHLPWTLVFIGFGIGMVIELLGLPVLPIAIGLYLPINLTTTIFVGGFIRGILDLKFLNFNEFQREEKIGSGILFSSGLIAGEGIVGIALAILSVLNINIVLGVNLGNMGTILLFSFLVFMLIKWSVLKKVEY